MSCYKKWLLFLWLGMAAKPILWAQHCHLALQGSVTDAETGDVLAFASVYVLEAQKGAMTDENGHFSIGNLCEDSIYTVSVSHVECSHQTQKVRLNENVRLDFRLVHAAHLKEVVVLEKAYTPPPAQAQAEVNAFDLEQGKGSNLAETLRQLPGLSSQKTGATIAKPVIHGLSGTRISIVNDGATLEAQQWGSEHAPEIDPFSASKITVLKGAAAIKYGSGAMGGAIILEPAPLRSEAGWGGVSSTYFQTNGWGFAQSAAVDFRHKKQKFAFRAQTSGKKTGNIRTPDYYLQNTGTEELNFSILANYRQNRWQHDWSASRFAQKIAVMRAAHIGNTTDLLRAISAETPLNNVNDFSWKIGRPFQDIQHNTLKYKALYRVSEKWKWENKYVFQFNKRQEFDARPPLSDPQDLQKRPQIGFRIWTNEYQSAFSHLPIKHWQSELGFTARYQLNYVDKGGLIPNFDSQNAALWASTRWRRYDRKFEFDGGLRLDWLRVHATDPNLALRHLDTTLRFALISASVGGIYHFSEAFSATFQTALATRAPHVNELFAQGVHHGAATFEQGKNDLTAEQAWNNNLTFKYQKQHFSAFLTLFHNQIRDFIYLQPTDVLVFSVRGAYPLYKFEQANARLQGIDFSVNMDFFKNWNADARFALLRGKLSGEQNYLPLMPADRFMYGLKYVFSEKKGGENFVRIGGNTVLKQTRIPQTGILKTPPPAYSTLDLEGGMAFKIFKKTCSAGFQIQNLFNVKYREYTDFFRLFADAQGVKGSVRFTVNF